MQHFKMSLSFYFSSRQKQFEDTPQGHRTKGLYVLTPRVDKTVDQMSCYERIDLKVLNEESVC